MCEEKPILDDFVIQAVSDVLRGMKSVEFNHGDWSVAGEWVGNKKAIILTIKSKHWGDVVEMKRR